MTKLKEPQALMRYAAIALVALLPFIYMPTAWSTPIQTKLLLVAVVVLFCAALWAFNIYKTRSISILRSPVLFAALVLPVVYGLSAILSGAAPSSLVSGTGDPENVSLIVLLVAVLAVFATAFRSAAEAGHAFVRAFLAGSLVLMLVQSFHTIFPSVPLGIGASAIANIFGSLHEVGIVAGAVVLLTAALWGTSVLSGMWRWVALVASIVSGLVLIIVNMLDIWYVLGGALLVLTAYRWYTSFETVNVRLLAVTAALGALSLAGAFAGPSLYDVLPQRLQVLHVEVRPSWSGTFAIGKESIDGVRTALLGSGPNTFVQQWSLYKPLGVNTTDFWNIDFNIGVGAVPTTFVTVGILGLLAWLGLLAALVLSFIQTLFGTARRVATQEYKGLLVGALYLFAFLILYVPGIALSVLTFAIFGAVAAYAGAPGPVGSPLEARDWKSMLRFAAVCLALVCVFIAALATIRVTVSEMFVNRSVALYAATGNTQNALSSLQTALRVYSNNDRAHRAAVELGLIRLGELAATGATTDQATAALQVSLETTIQHGLAAVEINNSDYRNWLALAGLYRDLAGSGVQGAYENAQGAYEKAYADNPKNPTPLVQMAQLEIALNKIPEAMLLLNEAIKLKPNFSAAYFLRSHAHSLLGNDASAIEDASIVVQITPSDPLGWYNLGTVLYDAERFQEAAQSLEQAAALQANYANALFVLGLTYDKLGRSADALRILESVAKSNPSDPDLARVIENIRSGSSAGSTDIQS